MRLLLSIFLLITGSLFAQEQLVAPGSNPSIKKYILDHPTAALRSMSASPLDLPFVDDFSYKGVYPDPARWTNNYAFVNNSFARNPVTIGVATLDGLDANGDAYVSTNPLASGSCDTLTSQPILLLTRPGSQGGGQYSPADSIVLSFFYQKRGWGDTPDNADSLVLEFFNPSTSRWARQWFSRGGITAGQDTIFYEVNLRILDTAYFKDGFQFRFRNHGSQTGALDQWHLDYIRLFKSKNTFTGIVDTTLNDVAFVLPPVSLLQGFTSIPWTAYKNLSASDRETLTKDSAQMIYRNIGSIQDVGFNHRIYDLNNVRVGGFGADNGNIFSAINPGVYSYAFPIDTVLPTAPELNADTSWFTTKNFFSNGNVFPGITSNDTVELRHNFYNYYSYDDGSAEAGYDLVNSPQGKLAQRFDLLQADTMRAVRLHWVQQTSSVTNLLFTLKIWSSLNPETVIYQETNQRPGYAGEIGGWATYVLDQLVPVSGTIYVGIQQITADGLHLGFDRNTTSNSKMFYNFNGPWTNVTVANGSFMIRPVMGDSALFTGLPEYQPSALQLYPNPGKSSIHISYPEPELVKVIRILSIEGKQMEVTTYKENFNTSDFASGVYFMYLQLTNGQTIIKRFAIAQ
jgi:hypothetical protein